MGNPDVRPLHVFWHDLFRIDPGVPDGPTAQHWAERELGTVGGTGGYTFTVLWQSDAIDGVDNLDQAIALATSMAYVEGGRAEVRIDQPVDDALSGVVDDWSDVTIFAIGPKAEVERAARNGHPDDQPRKRPRKKR